MSQENHILLSAMGVGPDRTTVYTLDGKLISSDYSSLALLQLLPEESRPTKLLFALTPEAMTVHSQQIREQARRLEVNCEFVEVAGNELPDDSSVFLERVADAVPENSAITLDVTQGLRHHAFLFYALALYLSQFRGINIAGAWYCRWEISRDDSVPRPFIDLKPTIVLARWFHALAVLNSTGSMRPIAEISLSHSPDSEFGQKMKELSSFFLNGSPIEAGRIATRANSIFGEGSLPQIPLHREIEIRLSERLQQLAGQEFEGQAKSGVSLDQAELERQARYIEHYFQSGQLNLAFGLLREWIVNWIAVQRGDTQQWLQRPFREEIENALGGLGQVFTAKESQEGKCKRYLHQSVRNSLSDQQREWAQRWNRVCEIRNALQHHGMKSAVFEPNGRGIEEAERDWRGWRDWQPPPKFGGGGGRLLICPIGLTPGVLFSAATHVQPDQILVIASQQSAEFVDEALRQAKCEAEIQSLLLIDIHTGIEEFDKRIAEAALMLFNADQIHANFTGGTSLMGALVNKLVARSRREYQRLVREFVLIDKRTPQEQRDQPWELGEIYYLDGEVANPEIVSGELGTTKVENS